MLQPTSFAIIPDQQDISSTMAQPISFAIIPEQQDISSMQRDLRFHA